MPFKTSEILEFFGIDKSTLTKWKNTGADAACLGRNAWDGHALLGWYIENLADRQAGRADPNLLEERRRLIKAKADREELKRDEEKGILINGDNVYSIMYDIAHQTRDSLLNIPNRIAPMVIGVNDTFQVKNIMEKEISYVLTSLHEQFRKFQDERERTDDAGL
jgi:phage terminase Nu1 subunit (DNA packaging protein)